MFAMLALDLFAAVASIAEPTPMSLSEVIALSRTQHPEVRRAEINVEETLARRIGASLLLQHSPDVSVDVGHRHDSSVSHPPSTGPEWTLRLSQMVDVAGQRATRMREVEWAVSAARSHLDETRLQAAATSAQDFVRAQAAEASVEVARARSELAQRVLAMVSAKEQAGATGGLERSLAEVEQADAQAQWQRALAARQAAHAALWFSLGLTDRPPTPLTPLAPPPLQASHLSDSLLDDDGTGNFFASCGSAGHSLRISAESARSDGCQGAACAEGARSIVVSEQNQAVANREACAQQMSHRAVLRRPLGQALLAVDQGLRGSLARLAREVVPSPTFSLEAQRQQPGQMYVGGGIQFGLPILQRQQSARSALRAQLHRNELERQLFAAKCRQEASVALRQLEAAMSVWRTVHSQQLPAAQRHLDMTVAAWKAGKLDLSLVVQSLRYLNEARQRLTDAVEALWRARIEHNRVLGELP